VNTGTRLCRGLTFATVFLIWYGWRLVGFELHPLQPLAIHLINLGLLLATLVTLDVTSAREMQSSPAGKDGTLERKPEGLQVGQPVV